MNKITVILHQENRKWILYSSTKAINRILSRIRHVYFKKAYVKATYGKKIDSFGNNVLFYNDGWYYSVKDAEQAISAFWNEV